MSEKEYENSNLSLADKIGIYNNYIAAANERNSGNGLKKRKFNNDYTANEKDVVYGNDSKKRKFPSLKNSMLRVKRLSKKATMPKKSANGYDIYSACNTVIPAYGEAIVNTDIIIDLPEDTQGHVVSMNGLDVKNFIGCNEYSSGPITVNLYNNSEADFEVKEGDRFANLVICCTPDVIEVNEIYKKRDKFEK